MDDTSNRDEASQSRLHIEEDSIIEQAEACFGGTLVIDVRRLTAEEVAIADNNVTHRYRELDLGLVEHLMQSFQIAIRRYSVEDRIRVITSQATINAVVDLLVDTESLSQNSPHSSVLKEGVISRMRMRTRFKDEILVLEKPELLSAELEPLRVVNGQHRIVALKSLIDEKNFSNQEPSQYYWAVDVYISDHMDDRTQKRLEANRLSVRKEDTEGFLAVRLFDSFKRLPHDRQAELLRAENMMRYLNTVFQARSAKVSRIVSICRSSVWSERAYRYCQTRYGERFFGWHLMWDIVNARLDELWLPIFDQFFYFAAAVFPDQGVSATCEDWRRIMQIKLPRDASELRILFFPSSSDYRRNGHKIKRGFPLEEKYSGGDNYQALSTPFHVKGNVFYSRRAGFLMRYIDIQYIAIYKSIAAHLEDLPCPTWGVMYALKDNVSEKVVKLIRHVLQWANPSWVMPGNASNALRDLAWSKELMAHVFSHVGPKDREDSLGQYLPKASHDVQQYFQRFRTDCWARIVVNVVKYAGPVLNGYMSSFNNTNYIEQLLGALNASEPVSNAINEDDSMMHGLPMRNTADFQLKFAEALRSYAELKRHMLATIEHGWDGNSNRASADHTIATLDDYRTAKETLKEYAHLLQSEGFEVDVDDANEDLTAFYVNENKSSSTHEPNRGFLEWLPQ